MHIKASHIVNLIWLWFGMICRDELSLELGLIIPNSKGQHYLPLAQKHHKSRLCDVILMSQMPVIQMFVIAIILFSSFC